jgi:hypothetical protein
MEQNTTQVNPMTQAERDELNRLREENQKLKQAKTVSHGMKITAKGGLSIYGFGRWPVTLYKSQWLALFERIEEIRAFIVANSDKLTEKPAKEPKAQEQNQVEPSAKAQLVDELTNVEFG